MIQNRHIIALALAYSTQSQIQEFLNDPKALANSQHAADLLQPLVYTPNPSIVARRAYVEVLVRVGFEQLRSTRFEDSARSLELSAKIASDLGARDLSDFGMAAYYAEANAWRVEALLRLGRVDEAKRVAEDAGSRRGQGARAASGVSSRPARAATAGGPTRGRYP